MNTLQEHLKSGEWYGNTGLRRPCKKIVCRNGFEVSVQASSTHYCTPKNNSGPYVDVELGYPSEPVEAWMEYAEDPDRPTDTVYGHVPIELVETVLEQHGGIDWDKTTTPKENEMKEKEPMFTPEELAEMDALDKAYKESAIAEKKAIEDYERAYKEGIRHILSTLDYSDEDANRMADECFNEMLDGVADDSRYW